jgi:O-antigen ligase
LKSFFGQPFSIKLSVAARISFALTIILIPFRYRWILLPRPMTPLYIDYTDFYLFAVDVTLITTLVLWTSSMIFLHNKLVLGPRHIWIPLAGLTLAGSISIITSLDTLLSLYHAIRLLLLFWFYLYIVNEVRSIVWVLIPVGLQVAIQAVVAVGQTLVQHSLGMQILGEHSLNPVLPGISIVTSGGIRLLRSYGLSDHPNILGGCLAFGILLFFSAYLYSSKPAPYLAVLLIGIPALLVTFSRSAWLALLGGVIFIMGEITIHHSQGLFKRIPLLILLSSILIAPFLLADAPFFGSRFDANNSFNSPSVEQQSIGERFLLINSTLPIFIKHTLFGVGLGASPRALELAYPNFPVGYEPPHLTELDAALETGLFGVAFYITLIISPFVVYIKKRNRLSSNPLTLTSIALLLSLSIVGFFDYYTWLLTPGRLWQWLAWGLWAVTYEQVSRNSQTLNPATS